MKEGFEPPTFGLWFQRSNQLNFFICSSYTFPYSYLVTTSSKLLIFQWTGFSYFKKNKKKTQFSGKTNFLHVTGGVYKAKVRIHRNVLICDYLWFQLHVNELQFTIRTKKIFKDQLKIFIFVTFCHFHCSTCVAQPIRATVTWLNSHLPLKFLLLTNSFFKAKFLMNTKN